MVLFSPEFIKWKNLTIPIKLITLSKIWTNYEWHSVFKPVNNAILYRFSEHYRSHQWPITPIYPSVKYLGESLKKPLASRKRNHESSPFQKKPWRDRSASASYAPMFKGNVEKTRFKEFFFVILPLCRWGGWVLRFRYRINRIKVESPPSKIYFSKLT